MAAAPPGVEVELYDGLRDLPHFNPDLEHGQSSWKTSWRQSPARSPARCAAGSGWPR